MSARRDALCAVVALCAPAGLVALALAGFLGIALNGAVAA